MDPEYFNVASQMALVVKNPPANAGDLRDAGSIPGLGRFLEKGMAIGSSILAWRIPCTEEPGRLQSTGSYTVGHDWSNLAHMHNTLIVIQKRSSKPDLNVHLFAIWKLSSLLISYFSRCTQCLRNWKVSDKSCLKETSVLQGVKDKNNLLHYILITAMA